MDKIEITWEQFDNMCFQLAENIKKYSSKHNFKYKRITGIARGGLIVAVRLAHILDIPELYSIGLCSYKKEENGKIYKYSDLPRKIKDTLIIDDITNTGNTFQFIKNNVELINSTFVSLFKQNDYEYGFELIFTEKTYNWIVFPWEKI